MGEMLNRRQQTLTKAVIKQIAAAYHQYRQEGGARPDEPGFCKVVMLDEINLQGEILADLEGLL